MFDHENEMKIHLADLQRHLEQRFSTEKDEKIMILNKDFEMKIDPVKALTDKIDGEYGSDSAEIFRMFVADLEHRQ